jgi:alcohol dehydrogenase class IV
VEVFDDTPGSRSSGLRAVARRDSASNSIIALGRRLVPRLGQGGRAAGSPSRAATQYAAVEGGAAKSQRSGAAHRRPTTAGTSNEVGRGTVIVLNDGRKVGLYRRTFCQVALCDRN